MALKVLGKIWVRLNFVPVQLSEKFRCISATNSSTLSVVSVTSPFVFHPCVKTTDHTDHSCLYRKSKGWVPRYFRCRRPNLLNSEQTCPLSLLLEDKSAFTYRTGNIWTLVLLILPHKLQCCLVFQLIGWISLSNSLCPHCDRSIRTSVCNIFSVVKPERFPLRLWQLNKNFVWIK